MSDPIDRSRRAKMLREEFLAPIIADIRAGYTARLTDIAATELDPKAREQKITSLATALRVLDNIERGMSAIIEDGALAEKQLLRTERIEKMSAPQRRLLNLVPY